MMGISMNRSKDTKTKGAKNKKNKKDKKRKILKGSMSKIVRDLKELSLVFWV